jgi:hypothetical protein
MTASPLDDLRNPGAVRIGAPVPSGPKTIVVLGVARGGTSMVASVLSSLGIFLGDQAAPPVFEDVRLATAIEAKDVPATRDVMRDYDARHDVWAFKRPALIDHLTAAHPSFRNPVYVVIFRDVLAIANRNVLSMKSDPLKSIKYSLKQYELVRSFLEARQPTALLVSNEKALLSPSGLVSELVDWLGLQVSEEARTAATGAIVVGHPTYLDASRLHFLGHLDRANLQEVSGWAYIKGGVGPTHVEVTVDGRVIATVVADLHRPDVQKRKGHPTGYCGFRYAVRPADGIAAGVQVSARFALGGVELKGVPRVVG